jgi:hypothetical protein
MGSAGPGLRSQGSSNKGMLSRCARGVGVIASRDRSGPIPLPPVLPGGIEPSAGHRAILAFQAGIQDPQPTKIPGMDEGIPLAVFPNSEIVP